MAKKKQFIDGIFNYCDRWCERCPMTARCRVFAMEQVHRKHAENLDEKNEAFWSELDAIFSETAESMADDAHELGFDLDLDPNSDPGEVEEDTSETWKPRRPKRTRLPTLTASAEQYMKAVQTFLDQHREQCDEKAKSFPLLADAMDVIQWYYMFVTVKLHRAARTHEPEDGDIEEDEAEFHRDDADGSAKLVLIGIDRSIQSWAVMRQQLPSLSADILKLLLSLVDLRDRVESAFPNARRFKRPGFED
jgi:hypothetical protein